MGLFDDLLPSAQRREGSTTPGIFDDLIPSPGSEMETGVSRVSGAPETSLRPQARGGFGAALGGDEPIEAAAPVRSAPPVEEEPVSTSAPRMRGQIKASRDREPVLTQPAGDLGRRAARGFSEIGAAVPEALAIYGLGDENTGGRASAEAYRGFAQREREMAELGRQALENDGLSDEERADIQRKIASAEQKAATYEDAAAQVDLARTPTEQRELYKTGDRLRAASLELFGTPDPQFDERFLSTLAEGGGNMVGFIATTLLGGLTGGAAAGAALNTSSTYKDAINHGATEQEAKAAAYIGAAIGSTEVIPIGRAFDMLPSKARQRVASMLGRRLANALATAGEEGVQEALAGIANNINAKVLSGYDPERGIGDDVLEQAVVGSILGFGVGAIAPISRRDDQERADSPRLTEDDRLSPIRNDIIDDGKAALERLGVAPAPEVASTGFDQALAPEQDAAPEPPEPQNSGLMAVSPPRGVERPEEEERPERPYDTPEPQAQTQAPGQPAAADEWEELPVFDADGNETNERVRVNWKTGEMVPVTQDAAPEADTSPATPEAAEVPRTQQEEQPSDATAPVESLEETDAQPSRQSGPDIPVVLTNDDLTSIETDAETFQYKSGGDESGVTDRLEGVSNWDTARAGTAIVFEYADGRRVIADGHQRLGLAKRLREQGQEVALPVIVRRETDGHTPQSVMVEAALKNIAETPIRGTPDPQMVIDAAKVLRAIPDRAEQSLNLPPNSALAKQSIAVRDLSDEAFGMLINDRASVRNAVAVGENVTDKAAHANILGMMEKLAIKNQFEAAQVARQAAADVTTETQTSLFGEEEVAQTNYLERARIMDLAIKRLRREEATFNTLLKRGGTITEAGNVLDQDANARKVKEDATARTYLSRLANSKGEISDALTEAARKLKAGADAGQTVTGFIDALRRGIAGDIEAGARGGEAGRGNEPQSGGGQEGQQAGLGLDFGSDATDPVAAHRQAFDEFDRLNAENKVSDPAAFFAASFRLSEARDNLADSIAEKGGRIELASKDGRGAVITPQGDGYQISYFDNRGFFGDTRHKDLRAAVRDAIGQGYEFKSDGLLKRTQQGEAWQSPAEAQRVRDEIEGPAAAPASLTAKSAEAQSGKDAGKESSTSADMPAVANDPLRKGGDWQDADLVAEDADGKEEEVNAGMAVKALFKRLGKAKRLLKCVRGNA